jgi:hypothetical protein
MKKQSIYLMLGILFILSFQSIRFIGCSTDKLPPVPIEEKIIIPQDALYARSYKVAFLIITFSDLPNPIRSCDEYQAMFIKRGTEGLNDYWICASHGAANLDGSQIYMKKLPITLVGFQDKFNGDNRRQRMIEGTKAYFPEIDFSKFDAVVIIPNDNVKEGSAAGNGVIANRSSVTGYTEQHNMFLAHELCHAIFSLPHSFGPDGEYNDPWDIMSAMRVFSYEHSKFGASGPLLNAVYMDKLGWLKKSRIYNRPPIKETETITLRALGHSELSGYLAIKINCPNLSYMVEFRQKDGFDKGIPRPTV